VFEGHHLGVREGLIPKVQQHRAAASSSSTGQTGGISFERKATLLPGQLQIVELAGNAGPALREELR